MAELKEKIEGPGYRIDSELVAEEILRKLRMVKWARRELVGARAGNPRPELRGL